ncbi:hypothetical protein D8674_041563 [Pyrus ussuriensis x Pyrus communis]|uniref:Uncharacterized protein n=1 Tax=Pyrus ussuriensis x Pyrus communis TaxID=2448454 RepID=A0A5N5H9T0_9ROSA|nr:hypothetical protein D8674_041563 [Pyrus ussuriensis x Pyrus communis]
MAAKISSPSSSYGNPCLDMFFHVTQKYFEDDTEQASHNSRLLNHLKQLLPLAWSHNALITLKLISNLDSGKLYDEAFFSAVFWLHHNHPKTLLCNVSFKDSYVLIDILYSLLEGQDAAERLRRDPDYKLLHDQVMDLFVERLKSDIEKLKQNKLKLKLNDDVGNDSDDDVFVTEAAAWCVSAYPSVSKDTCAGLLRESVERRLFPHQSSVHSQEWKRLAKEVLEPLTNYYNLRGIYLGAIAAGNLSGIKYDALLPHQVILYAEDGSDVKQAAELQWKTTVEGMHLKGKLRNYFTVYHTTKYADKGLGGRMMLGLALLLSQLSEGPWKGKVIVFGNSAKDQPLLCPIQGKDLKYKCEFMTTMESDLFVDYEKLFDIPEVAAIAKGSVKPEQMIKTVFVFSDTTIRRKFKDKAYGDDTVPHILFWIFGDLEDPSMPPKQHPGVYEYNLVKVFLDNGGEIVPRHLREAALSDKDYQTLAVVDRISTDQLILNPLDWGWIGLISFTVFVFSFLLIFRHRLHYL